MIVKFDGIDGCGKSTLSAAVREAVSARGFSAALVGEFSSPCLYNEASKQMSPISSMMIRESVLDPSFDCDDIERQLLLHYLSRRRTRVEIALLSESFDYRRSLNSEQLCLRIRAEPKIQGIDGPRGRWNGKS
jgi:thymidylate kinase